MKSAIEAGSAWAASWSLAIYWCAKLRHSLGRQQARDWFGKQVITVAIPGTRRCWKFRELATLWLWVFSLFRHIQARELEPCEQDSVFRAGRMRQDLRVPARYMNTGKEMELWAKQLRQKRRFSRWWWESRGSCQEGLQFKGFHECLDSFLAPGA